MFSLYLKMQLYKTEIFFRAVKKTNTLMVYYEQFICFNDTNLF